MTQTFTCEPGGLKNETLFDPSEGKTAELVAGPNLAAEFNLNGDGTFDYVPLGAAVAFDAFSYRICEGGVYGETVAVSIQVGGPSAQTAPESELVAAEVDTEPVDVPPEEPEVEPTITTTEAVVETAAESEPPDVSEVTEAAPVDEGAGEESPVDEAKPETSDEPEVTEDAETN